MRRIVVIGILCCAFGATAQPVDSIPLTKLALKWSPMHFIYFFPSAQISLEHKLFNKINVQYEVGFVGDYDTRTERYSDKRGYRGALELRYYLPSPRMIPLYVSAEYYYNNIRFDRTELIGFSCIGSACDYYQYASYRVRYKEQGPGMKFGILLYPGWRHNHRFFFDINVGFSHRNIDSQEGYTPVGQNIARFYDNYDHFFEPDESIRKKMRFILGVRFSYRFL